MTRVDVLAVRRGLAPTRSAAARLVASGAIRVCRGGIWTPVRKAGEPIAGDCALELVDGAELRWVSRSGLKLDGALDRGGIDALGNVCLDIGQSTGGFTDVLLARGAARVIGVDVGHHQLHPRLRADPRVVAIEGVNARHLDSASLPEARFDLVVADLSFISLALVMPALAALDANEWLLLAKPQFELQPADIGKGGIVRDASNYARVEQRLREASVAAGFTVLDWFESPIAGGDGNREFFLHGRRSKVARP